MLGIRQFCKCGLIFDNAQELILHQKAWLRGGYCLFKVGFYRAKRTTGDGRNIIPIDKDPKFYAFMLLNFRKKFYETIKNGDVIWCLEWYALINGDDDYCRQYLNDAETHIPCELCRDGGR